MDTNLHVACLSPQLCHIHCVEGRFPVKVIYSAVFTRNVVMKRDVKLRLLRCKVRLIYIKACGEIGALNNPERPVRLVMSMHRSVLRSQCCAAHVTRHSTHCMHSPEYRVCWMQPIRLC